MARARLQLGPIPLHHQVYLDLRGALDDGEWRPDERLPSERELARSYGCSLITVRRALGELTREGRLLRTRGRGTTVIAPRIDRDLSDPQSFTEEMLRRGFDPQTRLLGSRPESASPAVAAALRLEPGSPTLYIERLRLADGEPILLEQVHLPAERFPGLLASDLEHASLYRLLADRYQAQVAWVRETLEPVLLGALPARLLGRPRRSPALLIEGTAFAVGGLPIELSRTWVRGDRTRYYVERIVVRRDVGSHDRTPSPAVSR